MAPSVLGIGIPATSDMVPWVARGFLQRSLNTMEADMKASLYDWEMLYLTPDTSFDLCTTKLHEKKWDVVMVGIPQSRILWLISSMMLVGLRKTDAMIPLFERIVNVVHTELPDAKFAFNISIVKTREAVDRVLASE
ncbi:hypothetical protein BKA64DRAFT_641869 [Cadophora sp. MPI-SDFR-AT-0126]|nr:hypothetical protein BKA64DRAFT_641869 [Leotiomycetes sp. MPI-SDFR-AT-0126]